MVDSEKKACILIYIYCQNHLYLGGGLGGCEYLYRGGRGRGAQGGGRGGRGERERSVGKPHVVHFERAVGERAFDVRRDDLDADERVGHVRDDGVELRARLRVRII